MASKQMTAEYRTAENDLQVDMIRAYRLATELERRIAALKAGIDKTTSGVAARSMSNRVVELSAEAKLLRKQIRYARTHSAEMIVEYYL